MRKLVLISTLCLLVGSSSLMAQSATDKISSFLNLLDKYYIDKVDQDSIVEEAIKSVLKDLDPHSNYLDHDALQKSNEQLGGNFEGVGIQFNILNDTIYVVQTISGGPSESVGIIGGDKIVEIDGEGVAGVGIENEGVIKRLRGEKGSKVEVKIKRHGDNKLLDFLITRDKIPLFAVDASYMVDDEIGYVRLSRFSATATEEVRAAIIDLKGQGMKDLILDLTGNGGGYLNEAIALGDEFLSDDKLIVYTEGRAYPKQEENAKVKGSFEEGNLVIMIDQNSASASEIVSGAVQDWDRGLLVGRRSFGKGLVQRAYYLPDRTAVRITIAKYFTPSGRFIQKPYEGGREAYYKDNLDRFESGELFGSTEFEFPDSIKHYTAGKRVVYGGGGIMPDIFVAIDTSFNSEYIARLSRRGILNRFTLDYVDHNREELETKFTNVKEFKAGFEVDEKLLEELYAYAKNNEVEPKEDEDFTNSLPWLSNTIKALVARNIWKSGAYFEISNDLNPIYKEAVTTIKDKKLYKKLKIAYNN
ncbi:MAG: S41 family peptidase [Chitinophagales bacterium]